MVAKRSDYSADAVEAAHSVLLELVRLLGEYQDAVVIVGGWVPELLISQSPHQHVGSLDVDIALDHRKLKEVGYKTILQLLLARGYQPSEQPFIFFRTVQLGEQTFDHVDDRQLLIRSPIQLPGIDHLRCCRFTIQTDDQERCLCAKHIRLPEALENRRDRPRKMAFNFHRQRPSVA